MPYVYSHKALSGEGRAARSLQGSHIDERHEWVSIQTKTFTNWLNEHLNSQQLHCADMCVDLRDGILLVRLLERLRGRPCRGRLYVDAPSEIQQLMNVQMAIDALLDDGVKLVNIGSYDVVEGNQKLLLGLLWCLILRYQFASKTRIPPKKLILAWLRAVLPDVAIRNFRGDWNDGRALSALVNYCQPTLMQNWTELDTNNGEANCAEAMSLAHTSMGVPPVLAAVDMSSPQLDELSCLTYISYFINTATAPGVLSTLTRVRQLIPGQRVNNFKEDWNDGRLLSELVTNLGGRVAGGWPHISTHPSHWNRNISNAMNAARGLGVQTQMTAEEMADVDCDQLSIMSFVAQLTNIDVSADGKTEDKTGERTAASIEPVLTPTINLHQQVHVDVLFHDSTLRVTDMRVEYEGDAAPAVDDRQLVRTDGGARATGVPTAKGTFTIRVYIRDIELPRSPISIEVIDGLTNQHRSSNADGLTNQHRPSNAMDDAPVLEFSELTEPMAAGSLVEVQINAQGRREEQGLVAVEVTSPQRVVRQCPVAQRGVRYTATFTPSDVGEWFVGIFLNGKHIRGSPFACHVFDPSLVDVYGLDVGTVGQELNFTVNAARAGEGKMHTQVLHNGRAIVCKMGEKARGVHSVRFTPDGPGQYKIHCKMNNVDIKGSPFILDIVDASSVSVFGDNLRTASVGKPASFQIHAVGANANDLTVSILAPSGKRKRAIVESTGSSAYVVEWVPVEAGEHHVDVCLYEESIHDSPFVCNVGDPTKVIVRNMPQRIGHELLQQPLNFEIDATKAGSGNLEIMINGGRVACKVREMATRQYIAEFVPVQPVTHIIEMRFNNDSVRDSPWRVEFNLPSSPRPGDMDSASMTGSVANVAEWADIEGVGLKQACVGKTSTFEIGARGLRAEEIEASLVGVHGERLPTRIIATQSGQYRVEYTTTTVGTHALSLKLRGREVTGSPFSIGSYDPSNVVIEPLPGGALGKPMKFTVDASHAGRGQIEISVNGGRVPNNVEMRGPGRCLVTFVPYDKGVYIIDVMFNGALIQGCPIRVDVGDAALGAIGANVVPSSSSSAVGGGTYRSGVMMGNDATTTNSSAYASTMTNSGESRTVYESGLGSRVIRSNEGSGTTPITTTTTEQRITTSTVTSNPAAQTYSHEGYTGHEEHTATIDTKYSADYSKSAIDTKFSAEASKSAIDTKLSADYSKSAVDSKYSADYSKSVMDTKYSAEASKSTSASTDPVKYTESTRASTIIKKHSDSSAEEIYSEVPPTEEKSRTAELVGRTENLVTADKSESVVRVGTLVNVLLQTRDSADVEATVFAPSKKSIASNIVRTTGGYQVSFTPREVGTHKVHVAVDGGLAASVHVCRVYDPSKIILSDIKDEVFPQTIKFTVDASKAGYGNLEIAILDKNSKILPSDVDQDPTAAARFIVSMRPTEPGEYIVQTNFNDESLDGSPFLVRSLPPTAIGKEEEKVEEHSLRKEEERLLVAPPPYVNPDHHVQVLNSREMDLVPASETALLKLRFSTTEAYKLTAEAIAPNEMSLPARIEGEGEDVFKVEFVPKTVGDHKLHVRFAGADVEGSPFTCRVYDARCIRVSEIPSGAVGKNVTFVVDASEAGVGNLEVAVNDGRVPSMAHSLGQHRYEISFVPRQPIDHNISIKFNKEAVPGSPFTCVISKLMPVKAAGPGLDRVPLGRSTTFTVECEGDGVPTVEITDVHGDNVEATVGATEGGGIVYTVEYKPRTVGTHQIAIFYEAHEIEHSPFTVKVYDAAQVKLFPAEKCVVERPCQFYIDAAKAGAGNMEIVVSSGEHNVPNFVEPEGNAKFKVTFTPLTATPHVISVKFNREPVPGSPMECIVAEEILPLKAAAVVPLKESPPPQAEDQVDATPITKSPPLSPSKMPRLSGHGSVQAIVGQTTSFTIATTSKADDTSVTITDASKHACQLSTTSHSGGRIVRFCASTVGEHAIRFVDDGRERRGTVNVIDTSVVAVDAPATAHIGEMCCIAVNTTIAGSGEIDVLVVDSQGRPMMVRHDEEEGEEENDHMHRFTFRPTKGGEYTVIVSMNNFRLPGDPPIIRTTDAVRCSVTGNGVTRVPRASVANVDIAVPRAYHVQEVAAQVYDGEGHPLPIKIRRNPLSDTASNIVKFELSYTPSSVGEHLVHLQLNGGVRVEGSPFTCHVYDVSKVVIRGWEDKYCMRGQRHTFTVDRDAAGVGDAEVEIRDADGRPVAHVFEGDDVISFTPTRLGDHALTLTFNGETVEGCPLTMRSIDPSAVTLDGLPAGLRVDRPAILSVKAAESGDAPLKITISDSSNRDLPLKTWRGGEGDLQVQYTPTVIGAHIIAVTLGGKSVGGTPHVVHVFDPTKVRLVPDENIGFYTKRPCVVRVDTTEAGDASIRASVTDAGGSTVKTVLKEDEVHFTPRSVGEHTVVVLYGEVEIDESPITLIVEDPEKPRAFGPGLKSGIVNERTTILFDSKKTKGALKVEVMGPSSKTKFESKKKNEGVYEINYTPIEMGTHKVHIAWRDKPVQGSPFVVPVVDPTAVKFVGLSDTRQLGLIVGVAKEMDVDCSQAGHGALEATLTDDESGGVIDVAVTPRGDDTPFVYRLRVVARSAGSHTISFVLHGVPLPESANVKCVAQLQSNKIAAPVERVAAASTAASKRNDDRDAPDHDRVVVTGNGCSKATVRFPTFVTIDGSDCASPHGRPSIVIYGKKADIPVDLTPLGDNQVWRAQYTAVIAGPYQMKITWNDEEVRGSPFNIAVDESGAADKIVVDAKSLAHGTVDRPLSAMIDTRLAQPGELTAVCVGPSGICATTLVEKEKLTTYEVTVRPTEVGKHKLSITYDGVHVRGSPFLVNISTLADPSKVRVYGPGVEHGILSKFKSNFVVETRGAGGGHLSVRVRGPKSAFHVDMQRDPRHDRTIHCKYEPKEPGDYQIEVKWAGQHVPNSPVLVMIFDTESELHRFHQGQMPSPHPPSPFLPPGFLPPPPPPGAMPQRMPGMPFGRPPPPPGFAGGGPPPPRPSLDMGGTSRSSRSQGRQGQQSVITAGGRSNGY